MNSLHDPRDAGPLSAELQASLQARARHIAGALKPSLLLWSDSQYPELPPISQRLAQRFLVDQAGAMGWPLLIVLVDGVFRTATQYGLLTWPLIAWPLFAMVVLFLSIRHTLLCIDGRALPSPLANIGWNFGLTIGPYLLGLTFSLVHIFEAVRAPSLLSTASLPVAGLLSYRLVRHTRFIQEFHWAMIRQVGP